MQVFYRTFGGEAGGRVGGGGQVPARSDLPGPGRGFGGGGGDGAEGRGVGAVAHLVLRLQRETSGQGGDGGETGEPSGSKRTSSGQLLSTQSCRWRSKPLEHLRRRNPGLFSRVKFRDGGSGCARTECLRGNSGGHGSSR